MSRDALPTLERLRRARRDLDAYRLRSLTRRSHLALLERYASVVPHVFLRRGACALAPLRRDAQEVRARLATRAVWTLDTAARLRWGTGLVRSGDLHAYLSEADLVWATGQGLVGPSQTTGLCLDPPYPRGAALVAHLTATQPPFVRAPGGERVVEAERWFRDLFGALGFRPDLLARVEHAMQARSEPAPGDEQAQPGAREEEAT